MSPELSYIDTCCLMMFVNRGDSLRRDFNLGSKSAENCVKKNITSLCVPMPAFGEAICKIRDKSKGNAEDAMLEMNRLMDTGFLAVRYLSNPYEIYGLARELSRSVNDQRDAVSPMDALILASATVDQDCRLFYTTDVKLYAGCKVLDTVSEWCESMGFDKMNVKQLSRILN